MQTTQPIMIRWPNEDTGEYFKIPGCLVAEYTAIAILDNHLEIHLVTPTTDPHEFDLRFASNPFFYVGDDLPTIFHDISSLSLVDLARKYTHSEFVEQPPFCMN
ncbi:hypothetical protein [Tumebacillus permanentifrigoris]|uniref:Uncharacterized protein n=1 Tax=Tumebacillus permanentifrigoris TaxID=378543 RepID=A0A316DFY5_9BACL|nr:hypothetical protein [Tumebacillus permanentifrigoris]PWK16149.1 hypothetical protein C7459_1019 [Tumebacillus permanentifrigoris]